jgi:type IV pilus assembly protein PilV
MLTMHAPRSSNHLCRPIAERGVTLIEILVTILILAFGLMGLAGMQAKVQTTQSESYQRAQAVLLVQGMANRISANRLNATSYLTVNALGTGDSQPASCAALIGSAQDQCEWSHEIQGAAEKQGTSSIGAMVAARGCVDQIAANPSVFRITVTWQGLSDLTTPSLGCGQGLYPRETLRRAISSYVTVANLAS